VTTFKYGDRVEHRTWGPGTIEVGPYNDNMYMVLFDKDSQFRPVSAGTLTPIHDPRWEVVIGALRYWTPEGTEFRHGAGVATVADGILTALDEHESTRLRRLRDRDGDVWEETAPGSDRWSLVDASGSGHADMVGLADLTDRSRLTVDNMCGPLEEIK
jgi:hypothetical protein